MREKSLHLNLASFPIRNRRFFLILTGLLAAVFLVVTISGTVMFGRYSIKTRGLRISLVEAQDQIRAIEREQTLSDLRIENMEKENRGDVEFFNGIIFQKTFSWADLLTRFEKALPDGCHLVSLRPVINEDLSLSLSFEFASPDMKGLLELVNRMRSLGFSNIRLLKESSGERGKTYYELVVRYDRAG